MYLLLINPQNHNNLVPIHPDELVDAPDPPPAELGEEDHALLVVVLEQVHVGAHLGDGTDLHHDDVVDLGKLVLVHAAVDVVGAAAALIGLRLRLVVLALALGSVDLISIVAPHVPTATRDRKSVV